MHDDALKIVSAAESRFDNPRVLAAVQAYLTALESGVPPDKETFVAGHPEISAELRECLDALDVVHGAVPGVRQGSGDDGAVSFDAPRLLGDFQLLREIGRGGMGVVYEAIQLSLHRRVAVKILAFAAALEHTHLQRFRNEAQAAAQLQHANIVPVYAVGSERGVHFYAMQLIDGEPLDRLIAHLRRRVGRQTQETKANRTDADTQSFAANEMSATQGFHQPSPIVAKPVGSSAARMPGGDADKPCRFRSAANLLRQAALALEHAHRCGVVHRDVKPANLLVNQDGHLWITDFGLAQMQAEVSLTRTGDVLGTLRYMSPEQAAGDRLVLDHRTDVYSLGCTLYEFLTLEPVFAGDDRHRLLRRIMEDEPRSLRALDPQIPLELETIVLKAMAKAPSDRYLTAGQFADDLQRWLDDKPVLARRPTLVERAAKWRRRHRTLVASAAVFLLLAFVGLAVSTVIIAGEHDKTRQAFVNETRQRQAADESFREARRAVDAFTELAEQELSRDPSLSPLRRKFLQTALEYYQSFLRQRRDDPRVLAELAASSARVERLIDDLAVLEGFAALPLLEHPLVLDELQIPPARRPELQAELAKLAAERRQALSGQGADAATRDQRLADSLRARQNKIAALVNAQQMSRLRQIFWQWLGPRAFLTAEVAAALRLSADDTSRLKQAIDEDDRQPHAGRGPFAGGPTRADSFAGPPKGHEPSPPPPPGRRPPPPEHRPPPSGRRPPPPEHRRPPPRDHAAREIRTPMHDEVERLLSLLTDEQRQAWRELIGEPFRLAPHGPLKNAD